MTIPRRVHENIPISSCQLEQSGYDPFIDFLKGICIMLVVLTHCIPSWLNESTLFIIWGAPAVPVFLLLQVFHAYKKGTNNVTTNYTKLWKRVIKPFIIMELVIISVCFITKCVLQDYNAKEFLEETILWGGLGPGSYYPWIYIQFAILMPFFAAIFQHISGAWLCIAFVAFAELIEIACSIYDIGQRTYRLLALRFVLIFYLGYLLATKRIVINTFTLFLSFLSLAATYVVSTGKDLEPFVFSFQYKSHHWFCFIYIAIIYIAVLQFIFHFVSAYMPTIRRYIIKVGKYSYEVFLFQMFYFVLIHEHVTKLLFSVSGHWTTSEVLAMLFALPTCVLFVITYKDWHLSHTLKT